MLGGLRLGPSRLPNVTRAYEHTRRLKQLILARFHVTNTAQFETTLTNELEFLAYMMEAYHARALRAPLRFAAPAFPTTREELRRLDDEFGLGITDALTEAIEIMVASGQAKAAPPVLPTPRTHSAAIFRERFEAAIAADPGMDPTAAAALVLRQLTIGAPSAAGAVDVA